MDENALDESVFEEERDSFMQPPTRSLRNFTLRKRKRRFGSSGREPDPDSISICSLDLENTDQPETKKKETPTSDVVSVCILYPAGPNELGAP